VVEITPETLSEKAIEAVIGGGEAQQLLEHRLHPSMLSFPSARLPNIPQISH
jgi:hypothetical protein